VSKSKIQKVNNNLYELIGRLDADSIPDLLVQSKKFSQQQNQNITIDLKAVTHSSSAGIALLLEWLRQASDSQLELQYANMPVKMKAIAEICGLTDILPIK